MAEPKKVISFNSGRPVGCVWCAMDGRYRPGYELYKSVFHEHAKFVACEFGEHVNFVFCSERHKQYYLNSHRNMGNLPAGHRPTL